MRTVIIIVLLLLVPFPLLQARPLHCTEQALKLFKPVPDIQFECSDNSSGMDWAQQRLADPRWKRSITDYSHKIITDFPKQWWSVPVEELMACDVLQQVGEIKEEQKEHYQIAAWRIQGNSHVRMFVVGDPCLGNGTATFPLNAFLFVSGQKRTTVTQVLNGAYSAYEYGPVDLSIKKIDQNEVIAKVHLTSGGFRSKCRVDTFAVNLITGLVKPQQTKSRWINCEN